MRYSVNPYIILPKTTIKFILKIMKTAIYTLVLLAATLIYGCEKATGTKRIATPAMIPAQDGTTK